MATTPPPPPPPPPPPASLSSSKSHPIPWTHQETVHLIHAYQEKWYSLERGQLKSSQWEEIAVTVAARCGYNHFDPSKTSVQCRHKMEKLRQRFRSEKQRLSIGTQSSSRWLYFDLMNNLLRGPLPISSARPIPLDNDEEDQIAEKSDHFNSDYEEEERNRSKSKSINHILRRPFAGDGSSSRRRNRNSSEEDEDEEVEEEEEEEEREIRVSRFPEEGKEMCSKLAAEIRLFADRLVAMESLKMEMMKEAEMNRIAMENRRIEMILESEKKILNSISKAFGNPPTKRLKIGHDS